MSSSVTEKGNPLVHLASLCFTFLLRCLELDPGLNVRLSWSPNEAVPFGFQHLTSERALFCTPWIPLAPQDCTPLTPLPICSSQLSSPGLSPTQLFVWEHLCCSFHPERKLLPFPSICLFLSIIQAQLRCCFEGKGASSL